MPYIWLRYFTGKPRVPFWTSLSMYENNQTKLHPLYSIRLSRFLSETGPIISRNLPYCHIGKRQEILSRPSMVVFTDLPSRNLSIHPNNWMDSKRKLSTVIMNRIVQPEIFCEDLQCGTVYSLRIVSENWLIAVIITNSDLNRPCFAWHLYGKLGLFKTELVIVSILEIVWKAKSQIHTTLTMRIH